MHTKLTISSIWGVILAAWAGSAGALSLGPVTGSTVVGRPLELRAAIRLDEEAQGSGSACVTARLLYGEKPVDGAKVQLTLAQDAVHQVTHATISTAVLVDEPFVTLVLRAGCDRQSTRRYVLLADAPKDEPGTVASGSSMSSGGAPVLIPAALGSPQAASGAPARVANTGGARTLVRSPVAGSASAPARIPTPRRGGMLQLAVWDPSSEQMPWLRASTALSSTPTADAAHRAAAAALWRALNAQPQDLLRTAERLRGLEDELGSLRRLAAGHRFEISSVRESLESSHSERHANLMLAVVLAMLAGGGTAFFRHRSRRAAGSAPAASWYDSLQSHTDEAQGFEQEPAQEPIPALRSQLAAERAPALPPQPIAAPGRLVPQPPLHAPLEYTLPDPSPAPPPAAAPQTIVGLNVDALHGAQQQSEFFVSLGQFDEAIAVLTAYLEESSERPVLPFLELFRIYHALEMREEYEELRSRFHQSFGIDATRFGDYIDEQRELELYPVATGRIAAGWPSTASQGVIEDLLFKKPLATRNLLSLHAYRELLWLYSLGQEIVYSTGMPAGLQLLRDRGLSNDHFILPWALGNQDGPPELSLDRIKAIDVAPELSAFAVDIDLTAAHGEESQHSRPEEMVAPETRPAATRFASTDATDAFDAVMESQSRRRFR